MRFHHCIVVLGAVIYLSANLGYASTNDAGQVGDVTIPPNKPALRETPTEKENHRIVYEWTKMIMSGHAKEAFEKYVSKDFVDHSHIVRSRTKNDRAGYAEALAGFAGMGAGAPAGGGAAPRPAEAAPTAGPPGGMSLKDIMRADDDMVINYGAVGADIFRVENGKITDHWDCTPMVTVLLKSELSD